MPAKKKEKRGVSLMLVSTILILVSLVLSISLIVMTRYARASYEEINLVSDGYIKCTEDIQLLDEVSDLLTSKSREYVVLGKEAAANDYIKEVTESKVRERSVQNINVYFSDTQIGTYMNDALDRSNQLSTREMYAMRLAAEVYGVNLIPQEIQAVEITAEDLALSNEEKISVATASLFDAEYDDLKDRIDDDILQSLTLLIAATTARKAQANRSLSLVIVFHESLGVLMFLFILGTAVMTYLLMILPLARNKTAIENNGRVTVMGARELRFVAEAYNRMYDAREKQQQDLEYEVSHDILTGISNRHEYIASCDKFGNRHLYFVIADVDRFKGINDTYGHDFGDVILTKVAHKLSESFPEPNRVFRVGGDEFIIFAIEERHMNGAALKEVLNGINASLSKERPSENYPSVSMSFGIVEKSEEMSFEDAYRKADKALYKVKETGGCGADLYLE